jgi:rSAM/selenodomain-associated transferase 1
VGAAAARVTVVCVFARPAVPGATKTRLAGMLGAEGAALLARAFFADTWAMLGGLDVRRVLATTDAGHGLGAVEAWLQGDGDLGARIERILRRGLADSAIAIAMGADSPGLPASRITDAIAALDAADAVLGPAEDGGFYLLGVRACPEGLLAGVPWSSATTCAAVHDRVEAAGLRVATLAPWWDVDEPADVDRLRAWLAEDPARAPRTAAALSR